MTLIHRMEFQAAKIPSSSFNTFRLGDKWYNKANFGDSVALFNKSTPLGVARIIGASTGLLSVLLPLYADENHINLLPDFDDVSPGPLTGATAQANLLEFLEDIYGAHNAWKDTLYTVVTMEIKNA